MIIRNSDYVAVWIFLNSDYVAMWRNSDEQTLIWLGYLVWEDGVI